MQTFPNSYRINLGHSEHDYVYVPRGFSPFSEIPQTVPLTSTVTETEMNHQHLNRHSQLISIGISLPFIQCPDI